MLSGEWTGTMNLTEPQAGSDLALVRTRAEPQSDGTYRLFGTKIFITYGEHDVAENIVHLVLARIPRPPSTYEGTTAIQANDFVGRKTARDGGHTARAIAAQVATTEAELAGRASVAARSLAKRLRAAREAYEQAIDFVCANAKENPNAAFAGSVPYLMLAGNLMSGWQLARSLLIAEDRLATGEGDAGFLQAKATTARFYAEHLPSKAPATRDAIVEGAESVTALAIEAF